MVVFFYGFAWWFSGFGVLWGVFGWLLVVLGWSACLLSVIVVAELVVLLRMVVWAFDFVCGLFICVPNRDLFVVLLV